MKAHKIKTKADVCINQYIDENSGPLAYLGYITKYHTCLEENDVARDSSECHYMLKKM